MNSSSILNQALLALIIKGFSALLGFYLGVIIANTYGEKGAGLYYLSFSIVLLTSILSKLGYPTYILKEFSSAITQHELTRINEILLKCILSSTTLAFILYFIAPTLSDYIFKSPDLEIFIKYASFAIIPYTLTFILSSLNQAQGKIVIAMSTQNFICYLGSCILILSLGKHFESHFSILFLAASAVISSLISFYFFYNINAHKVIFTFQLKMKETNGAYLFSEVLVAFNNWLPLILVGILLTPEMTGVYAISSRVSWLIAFLLVSVNAVVAPILARQFKSGKLKKAKSIYLKFTFIISAITIPIAVTCIFFSESILLMFGEEFIKGSNVLAVLISAQVINAATGPINLVLLMSGKAKHANLCNVSSIIIGSLLIILLTKHFSLLGASIGSAIMMIMANLLMVYTVFFKLRTFRE